jgi:hypothetical protein
MTEHGTAHSDLKIVRALGQEFDRLAAGEGQKRRGGGRWRVAVLALAGALLATAGAGAATGVLDVGTVFRGEGFDGGGAGAAATDETVVATGTTPVAGRWQLTVFESKETRVGGEVVEPAGLTCLKLRLPDPQGQRFGGGGFCGDTSQFTATFLASPDPAARGQVLIFGWAPEEAAAVQLSAAGVPAIRAVLQGPPDVPGDFFLIAAPPGLKNARVDWLRTDGLQPGRDFSHAFEPQQAP